MPVLMFDTNDVYVDVLLPLALPQVYTYFVPEALHKQIKIGKRVEVQFGKTRVYAGLVSAVHHNLKLSYVPKAVISVMDERPIVEQLQLNFWKWVAHYYLCSEGEVMQAALPAAFKLSSETKVILNPAFNEDLSVLTDNEFLVHEALSLQGELSVKEIQNILDIKSTYRIIKSLISKQVITLEEELQYKYKPKFEYFVQLHPNINDDNIDEAAQSLKRAKKQEQLLIEFLSLCDELGTDRLKRSYLVKQSGLSTALVNALVKKEILVVEKEQTNRLDVDPDENLIEYKFSESQQKAYNALQKNVASKQVTLLHGITSSGKTQLYIKMMQRVIDEGGQILYLLPEIALTAQIIRRLRLALSCKTGIYHSKFNDNERIELWQDVKAGEIGVVVGARSSIFLPFKNLKLIIIDEAHDSSYKQFDPAPRYHARDAAIKLSTMCGAKVILGSATPSIENYYKAQKGLFGLVELKERYGGVKAPEIDIIDIKEAARKRQMHTHFSFQLIEALKTALNQQEQVILFQNRRGYTPALVCNSCGYVPRCVQCDVSLTYHKFINELLCHQCGYRKRLSQTCVRCGESDTRIRNFGTEKVEEDLQTLLPGIKIARMDIDTVKRKEAHSKLITAFEQQEIDILVGTQMVAKGLDFENVTLVGVINADQLLRFPDFRAYERAFQLMTQVSGRAGRRKKQGKVLIQTYEPADEIFGWVIENDYTTLYECEMGDRKTFSYPPYCRLIHIQLRHKNAQIAERAAEYLAAILKAYFGTRLIGPSVPIISYIRNFYLRELLLKLKVQSTQLEQEKDYIQRCIHQLKAQADFRSVIVKLDVDPV